MLASVLLATACTDHELPFPQESSSTIPVDEAIETLNNALSALTPFTKSGDSPEVAEILTVAKGDVIPDAADGSIAYVVNFADNEGFALLAADRNLPDPIIAIVENGRMDKNLKIHNFSKTKGSSSQDSSNVFIEKLLSSYIICNEGGGEGGDDDEERPDDFPEDPGTPWNPGSPSEWTVYSAVSPMVPLLWHQSYPFNENYPIYSGEDHRKAGCVPLAIAMIMTYHQYPNFLTINGHTINWNIVDQVHRVTNGVFNPGYLGFDDVAELVYWVGLGCNMTYLPFNNTFAWPEDAKDFLQMCGYTNATNHLGYDADLIIDMLDDSKPVFIAADVHAWVIDGMIRLRNGAEYRDLFHCNMGWGGPCNGYYASRAFKSSKRIFADSNYGDDDIDRSFNFNTVFRIITY